MPPRIVPSAVLIAVLLAGSPPAGARIPVCIQFIGPTLPHPSEYQRLLALEMRHHPTHRLVTSGCKSRLVLEYVQLKSTGLLTGRIAGGIPHRVQVKRVRDLPAKIREMVAFLLKREPVFLVEHMETSGLLNPPRLALRRDGVNLFGLEASELFLIVGRHVAPMPKLTFRFRRSVDTWFLGTLASAAVNLRSVPRDPDTGERSLSSPLFRLYFAARVETGYWFLPDRNWSLYASGLMGVSVVYAYDHNPVLGGVDDLASAMGEISGRLGVEGFRIYAFRLGCHVQVNLPFYKYYDPDYRRVDVWVPSFELGCGIAF